MVVQWLERPKLVLNLELLFANTRTTLTWAPLRLMMWNMSFHAEHHFCPSMPFHALEKAHQQLQSHLNQVDPGYIAVNANIMRNLGQTTASTSS